MGRPKVPDSERRRAAVACTYCRAMKKKCSATIPCVHCQRRGIGASCSFTSLQPRPENAAPRSLRTRSPAAVASVASMPARAMTPQTVVSVSSPRDVSLNINFDQGSIRQDQSSISSTTAVSPSTHKRRHSGADSTPPHKHVRTAKCPPDGRGTWTRPRFLLNRRGEQVYIGQAASLSFLQLAREIVTEHIGPSEFSHNGKIQTMLETASPRAVAQTPVPPIRISLDMDQMLAYARTFNSSVDGLMGLFAPSEIEGLLVGSNATDARYRNPYKRATIDLIIAIGAQCTSPDSDVEVGRPYFRHAQQLAVSETLEDPNVDMIRAFLLMAFYMLGSCRRNAAFMYIGIATRTAVILGLHSCDSYTDMTLPRFQLRLRIWVSLCILDMTVSAILGRPSATAVLRNDLDRHVDRMAAAMHDSDMDLGVLMASYKILSIITDIVDNLYGCSAVPSAFIEQYLDTIEAWKVEYGTLIQMDEKHGVEGVRRSSNSIGNSIGKIHASCFYYFAVTLVTRPILVLTLVAPQNGFCTTWSQMAQACYKAAIYLVQTCVDAQDADTLLGNMCILKALVFVAGLILGLQSFSKPQIDYEVETAFAGARRNLEFLALQSPQANHYHEILRLLQRAITKQRQHYARLNRSRYVSKLYAKEPSPSSSALNINDLLDPSPVAEFNQDADEAFIQSNDEILFNWDHLDLSQWDNFLQLNSPSNKASPTDALDIV